MHGREYACVHLYMFVGVYVYMCVCMYVCMYAYMYVVGRGGSLVYSTPFTPLNRLCISLLN